MSVWLRSLTIGAELTSKGSNSQAHVVCLNSQSLDIAVGVRNSVGLVAFVGHLSRAESKGLNYKAFVVLVCINSQSPDMSGGVHVDIDIWIGQGGLSSMTLRTPSFFLWILYGA